MKHRKDIMDKAKILGKERGNTNYTSRFDEIERILAEYECHHPPPPFCISVHPFKFGWL